MAHTKHGRYYRVPKTVCAELGELLPPMQEKRHISHLGSPLGNYLRKHDDKRVPRGHHKTKSLHMAHTKHGRYYRVPKTVCAELGELFSRTQARAEGIRQRARSGAHMPLWVTKASLSPITHSEPIIFPRFNSSVALRAFFAL